MALTNRPSHFCQMLIFLLTLMCTVCLSTSSTDHPRPPAPADYEIFTCAGKCGQVIQVPCSCDARCIPMRNCCENMTLDCPLVWAEGRHKFQHLLDVNVECSVFGVFVVTSCPATTTGSLQNTSGLPKEDIRQTKSNMNTDSEEQVEETSLINRLKEAIVTDITTYISYLTLDIFHCNGGRRDSGAQWIVLITQNGKPKDDHYVDRIRVDFVPPASLQSEDLAACYPDVIDTCTTTKYLENLLELETLCENFTSYVAYDDFSADSVIYKNRYCGLCGVNPERHFQPVKESYEYPYRMRSNGFEFSVLLSLTEDGAISITQPERKKTWFKWQTVTCLANDMGDQEQGNPRSGTIDLGETLPSLQGSLPETQHCHITECSGNFELGPEGDCKVAHNAFVSVPANQFPMTSVEMTMFPSFLTCVFSKFVGLDLPRSKYLQSTIVFDSSLNNTVHFWTFRAYFPYSLTNLINELRVNDRVLRLSVVFHFLHQYLREKRHTDQCCSARVKDSQEPNTSRKSETKSFLIDSKQWSCPIPNYNPDDLDVIATEQAADSLFPVLTQNPGRGAVVDNNSIVFCLASTEADNDMDGYPILQCVTDSLYEQEIDLMKNLSELNCLSVFQDTAPISGQTRLLATWFIVAVIASTNTIEFLKN